MKYKARVLIQTVEFEADEDEFRARAAVWEYFRTLAEKIELGKVIGLKLEKVEDE